MYLRARTADECCASIACHWETSFPAPSARRSTKMSDDSLTPLEMLIVVVIFITLMSIGVGVFTPMDMGRMIEKALNL